VTRRKPSTIFRGSELPRLLLLAGIVVAGWPMILLFSHSQEDEPPPPPSVAVDKITKIVPDESVEFQAIVDKDFVLPRRRAATSSGPSSGSGPGPIEACRSTSKGPSRKS
jgi:hypothetical protein